MEDTQAQMEAKLQQLKGLMQRMRIEHGPGAVQVQQVPSSSSFTADAADGDINTGEEKDEENHEHTDDEAGEDDSTEVDTSAPNGEEQPAKELSRREKKRLEFDQAAEGIKAAMRKSDKIRELAAEAAKCMRSGKPFTNEVLEHDSETDGQSSQQETLKQLIAQSVSADETYMAEMQRAVEAFNEDCKTLNTLARVFGPSCDVTVELRNELYRQAPKVDIWNDAIKRSAELLTATSIVKDMFIVELEHEAGGGSKSTFAECSKKSAKFQQAPAHIKAAIEAEIRASQRKSGGRAVGNTDGAADLPTTSQQKTPNSNASTAAETKPIPNSSQSKVDSPSKKVNSLQSKTSTTIDQDPKTHTDTSNTKKSTEKQEPYKTSEPQDKAATGQWGEPKGWAGDSSDEDDYDPNADDCDDYDDEARYGKATGLGWL